MSTTNLTTEQKELRNLLYFINALLMIVYFSLNYYKLIHQEYQNLLNSLMVILYGIIFTIGYRKKIINKLSLIFTLLFVAIIMTIALYKR
jgi:ABC-type proline/glycine betaine transport system permease subunit